MEIELNPSVEGHFRGVATKKLTKVECPRAGSNQHELNGVSQLKKVIGTDDRHGIVTKFMYFGPNEESVLSALGSVSWYDSRANQPKRSAEYRLYYSDNPVMDQMSEGDTCIVALLHNDELAVLVISPECYSYRQILWFFGIGENVGDRFQSIDVTGSNDDASAIYSYIADEIGIPLGANVKDDWLDLLQENFGSDWPTTKQFSNLALKSFKDNLDPINNPDRTLLELVNREEEMFRQFERHLLSIRLREEASSWVSNVDAFTDCALSVINRRKARAGQALENHLEWMFQSNSLKFQRGVLTEKKKKPDFLFPGREAYENPAFPAEGLSMLGAKITLKDRWRQVLTEADRVSRKHLVTLQPTVSVDQMLQMKAESLNLVVPSPLWKDYPDRERDSLITLSDFIHHVKEREKYSE